MISAWWVQIIFRIINFFIILFLFVHVFVKYMYPTLKDQLACYLKSFRVLKQDIRAKINQGKDLDNDIDAQKKEVSTLLENVKSWHVFIGKGREKHNYEASIRMQSIKKIFKKQAEHYKMTRFYKKITPQVFEQATLELSRQYRDDKRKTNQVMDTIFKTVAQKNE